MLHILQEYPSGVEVVVSEDEGKNEADTTHDEQYQLESDPTAFHVSASSDEIMAYRKTSMKFSFPPKAQLASQM
jgi:hypothetical protein